MGTNGSTTRRKLARRIAAFTGEHSNAILLEYAALAVVTSGLALFILAIVVGVAGELTEAAKALPVRR